MRADHENPIIKAIDAFTKEWPDAEWGPAHIVLSDFNLGDGHIKWCRELIEKALGNKVVDYGGSLGVIDYSEHEDEELIATDEFLVKLLEIPENEREWVWLDDDDLDQ